MRLVRPQSFGAPLDAYLDQMAAAISGVYKTAPVDPTDPGTGGSTPPPAGSPGRVGVGGSSAPENPVSISIYNTSGAVVTPGEVLGWSGTGVLTSAVSGVRGVMVSLSLAVPGAKVSAVVVGPAKVRGEGGTLTWRTGDPVWRSGTVAGAVTNIRPASGAQLLGQCRDIVDPVTGMLPILFNPVLSQQT